MYTLRQKTPNLGCTYTPSAALRGEEVFSQKTNIHTDTYIYMYIIYMYTYIYTVRQKPPNLGCTYAPSAALLGEIAN